MHRPTIAIAVAALMLAVFPADAKAANPSASFNTARAFSTYFSLPGTGIGNFGTGIVAADFNNDGLPDIAVAEPGSQRVSIILSYGNDSFHAPILTTGFGPGPSQLQTTSIVAADFNHDGFMDVAVSGGDSLGVYVALGNGDGTLRTPVQTGVSLWPIKVADVNNDGIPDLAGGNLAGANSSDPQSSIAILLGNGDGTFAAAPPVLVGAGPIGTVEVADFNGDGKADLIYFSGQIFIAFGTGGGAFGAPSAIDAPAGNFLVADANGDGKPDLIALASAGTGLWTLLGNGNGTFQPGVFSSVPGNIDRFDGDHVARDLNGDGKLDLVLGPASYEPAGYFYVSLGNGDGTFTYLRALPVGGPSLAAADFNGDGTPDLAVGNESQASVLINYANADFQQPPAGSTIAEPASPPPDDIVRPFWAFPGDFNSDGIQDVIAVGDGVQVFLNDGKGALTPSYIVNQASFPSTRAAASADFDGDGRADVVVVTAGRIEEFSNKGDGTLAAVKVSTPITDSPSVMDMKAGDFDKNGKMDIAVLYQTPAELVIYPGNGDGTFGPGIVSPVGGIPFGLDTNDYDGDGNPDAIVVDQLQGFSVFRGNGTGRFQFLNSVHDPYIYGIASGDVNGDHKVDLVTTNWTNQGAATFLGNGDGTFQLPGGSPSHISGGMNYPRQVILGDLNGDGFLDVIAANNGSNDLTVLMGKGDGNFYTAQRFICAQQFPVGLALGSFYGQSIPDLAVVATENIAYARHVIVLKNGSPR